MKIDKIDRDIINALVENSRSSFRDISKKIGVSVVTVLKRVKRLESFHVIKGYTCRLEYDILGYDLPALIRISIAKGKLFEVEQKIAKNSHVYAIYDVTGDFDAVILARFKNRRGLDAFIKGLQAYEYIEKTQTNLILNTLKDMQTILD